MRFLEVMSFTEAYKVLKGGWPTLSEGNDVIDL